MDDKWLWKAMNTKMNRVHCPDAPQESSVGGNAAVKTIAIIGASGFIGLRLTEILAELHLDVPRPIVRSHSSLAVLARRRLDCRVTDFFDVRELARHLEGCDVVVHAAIGDARQIVKMAEAAYEGCALAGVRRLVWLSSASVHGQNPEPGTDESSSLHDRHALIYNNAKVRAEWALDRHERDRRVEVVKLRPSVVFGPRSRWIADAAEAILVGGAAWINRGEGICNSIYVDNLVQAIRLAAIVPKAAGNSFLIGDWENITWRDFLLPIATSLGYGESQWANISSPSFEPESESALAGVALTPAYQRLSDAIPSRAKRIVKAMVTAWPSPPRPPDGWALQCRPRVGISHEMALLQQCQWKLPGEKARVVLGYQPEVSFSTGMQHSIGWLGFAGYCAEVNVQPTTSEPCGIPSST